MRAIIKIEIKRIMTKWVLFVFFCAVLLLSVRSNYYAINSYEIRDENGLVSSGPENMTHGKANGQTKEIEDAIAARKNSSQKAVYIDETNIEELVGMNYAGKAAKDLSHDEIHSFMQKRMEMIEILLEENSHISYTETEKNQFLKSAGQLTHLPVGYSEGWKILNRDIGKFIPLILVMISILIIPLFSDDAQTKMKELCRSTRNGTKCLNSAKIIVAFQIGTVLYLISIILYFMIKMFSFGLSGADLYIQSNAETFFSIYHITYLEQFLYHCILGYVALVFVIALTILAAVIMQKIMAGIVVVVFFWILLLVMEQMLQYDVNHWFANFMPLRMSDGFNYFIGNEIYRFAGDSIGSILWCPAVTLLLSIMMTLGAVICMNKRIGWK